MDWRTWITTARSAQRVGAVIALLAGVAAAVTAVVIVADLVRAEPVANLDGLLIVGVPLVAVGQVWMIALISARSPALPGGWAARMRRGVGSQRMNLRNPRTFLFGDLDPVPAWSLLVLFLLGWVSAITAIYLIVGGNPAGAGNGCAYRLDDHGVYSCVSRTTYLRAGAGVQRFAAGILLGFYALHTGAALGGLRRHRAAEHPV